MPVITSCITSNSRGAAYQAERARKSFRHCAFVLGPIDSARAPHIGASLHFGKALAVKATSSELDKFLLAKLKQQTRPTIPPHDCLLANDRAEARNSVRRSPLKAFAAKIVTSGEPP
jgi:hypothetical protein